MPVVEVQLWDVARVADTDMSLDEIEQVLTVLKAEVEEVSDDTLTYEASHDRPDLYSAEGLGRAAAIYLGKRKQGRYDVRGPVTELDISSAPKYRPYAFLAIVRGVRLDDEAIRQLFQLQEKLHLSHCGDRALVSIGLYDLDKLRPPFRYVAVEDAEFVPLGYDTSMSLSEVLEKTEKGVKYAHLVKRGEYPLLVDSSGEVMSFPPILNSEENKVTEETRNVLIDVTGTEPWLMLKVLNIVTTSVLERGYGEAVVESVKIVGAEGAPEVTPDLRGIVLRVGLSDVNDLIGWVGSTDDVRVVLERMGYSVEEVTRDAVVVWAPPWRADVLSWVDVAEDIAAGYGYGRLRPEALPPTHWGREHLLERVSSVLRDIMLGLGFNEVVNYMLIDAGLLRELGYERFVEIENPKMVTYSAVRPSLLPSMILTVKENTELTPPLKVFEIGDAVALEDKEPITYRGLGFAIANTKLSLTDGLVIVKALFRTLGAEVSLRPGDAPPTIAGRTASIIVNDKVVGVVGEVHPRVLNTLGIEYPVVAGELVLNDVAEALGIGEAPKLSPKP